MWRLRVEQRNAAATTASHRADSARSGGPGRWCRPARRRAALASGQHAPAAPCTAAARLEDEPRAARVDQRRLVSGGAVAPHRKLKGRVQVLEVRVPVAAALTCVAAWARAPWGGRCISPRSSPRACCWADMRVTCPHARAEGAGGTSAGCSRLGTRRNSSTAPVAHKGACSPALRQTAPILERGFACMPLHVTCAHIMHAARTRACPQVHVWLRVSPPRCAGARPGSTPATASGAKSHCGTSQRGASAAVIRTRTTPAAGMVTARESRSMSGPSSGAVVSAAVSVAEKRAPVCAQRAA